jgi:hypothetical protein
MEIHRDVFGIKAGIFLEVTTYVFIDGSKNHNIIEAEHGREVSISSEKLLEILRNANYPMEEVPPYFFPNYEYDIDSSCFAKL